MYRSNHFVSQNVGQSLSGGQGLAGGQGLTADHSSVKKPNQQMPFTSSIQAIETNGTPGLSQPHLNTHWQDGQPPSQYVEPQPLPPRLERQPLAQAVPAQKSLSQKPLAQKSLAQNGQRSLSSMIETSQIQGDHPSSDLSAQRQSQIDPQISALFTAMGRASQLSHAQLAARLQTSPSLISALENGSLHDLPPWEEIEPVIARYADFMNIDDRAIVRRLREQLTEHYLTNLTADQQSSVAGPVSFQKETPPPLKPEHSQNGASIMPSSDMSLKAFANGNLSSKGADTNQYGMSGDLSSANGLNYQSLEERFTALTSAVAESQNTSHIIAQNHTKSQPLDTRSAIAGFNNTSSQQVNNFANAEQMNSQGSHSHAGIAGGIAGQQANYANPQFLNTAPQQDNQTSVALGQSMAKRKNKWLRIFGNFALVMILLVGFINWQPNRFWSGVDQLPKPISKSIYTLFEFVMPDPLASVYRMNWVHVADPRMRKSDKLAVPTVRKLPRIDFSKLGSLSN